MRLSGLRSLAYLKRIAKALERANELEEWRQQCEITPMRTGTPRRAVISTKRMKEERESNG